MPTPRKTPPRAAPKAGPRRTPRQERSRATHDAIVEAAARVFAESGLAGATTARIAEVAGVSPGSMYQYFPGKDALVRAVFEREARSQYGVFLGHVEALGAEDIPRLVRAFVGTIVGVVAERAALYRVLLHEVPRIAGLGPTMAVDRQAAAALRPILEAAGDRVRARNLDAAAMILVRALRYNTIAMVDEMPPPGPAREAFVEEMSDMLVAYALAPRTWRDP